MVAFNVAVAVPRKLIIHAAGVNLNKAHAAFDQAASRQTLAREVVTLFITDAVQILNVFRLGRQIECFRSCRLHPIRQFKTFNPRREFRVCGVLFLMESIELLEQI